MNRMFTDLHKTIKGDLEACTYDFVEDRFVVRLPFVEFTRFTRELDFTESCSASSLRMAVRNGFTSCLSGINNRVIK